VRLDEPSWWYGREPTGIVGLLAPISSLYGWVAETRYLQARAYRSRLPVVCIGNFTAGGTGKTPLALHLCERLAAAGHAPVALTRGYGGSLAGPYWVDAGRDRAREVGDEALLLARSAPTMVARDRAAGARAIESGPHPATVIVMDDGLQNPQLAKDLTIAVVDGRRGIGNGHIIPVGPLRAPLGFQLELTDAIVVNQPAGEEGPVADWLRHRFAGPVLRASTAPAGATEWLAGARVVAWAGIGAPDRFFATLQAVGAEIVERCTFRDHQQLAHADATRLIETAQRLSATLVTTEKDLARLAGAGGTLGELAGTSRALAVRLSLAPADEERLTALIDSALTNRGA
jgi:tetraacyldisaccharide 4'-kinase